MAAAASGAGDGDEDRRRHVTVRVVYTENSDDDDDDGQRRLRGCSLWTRATQQQQHWKQLSYGPDFHEAAP